MRGWLAANLFLLVMVLVAAGPLYLSLAAVRAFGFSDDTERIIMGFLAVATLFATGIIGKWLLSVLERRSRAR